MTPLDDNSLNRQLAALSCWEGGSPGLWRAALVSARPKLKRWTTLLHRPVTAGIAAVLLILLPVGILVSLNLPHSGPARDRARRADLRGIGQAMYIYAQDDPGIFPSLGSTDLWSMVRQDNKTPKQFIVPSTTDSPASASYGHQYQSAESQIETSSVPRHVARKATMELATPDVRAAFHKALHVIQEARGEYIQDSSISGAEENLYAQLTLRVAADRLSDVVIALRQLGTVRTEQTEGQDVTAQVVDLDAQLRNERRVETEMLELLDKRNDAPLSDILQLREKLREVRREIERLTGQRDQLGRLVSLASVLVLVRSSDAAPPTSGMAQYFKESCTNAWNRGLTFLADTLGGAIGIAVGGFLWWLLALGIGISIWRWRRIRNRDEGVGSSGNPPPRS